MSGVPPPATAATDQQIGALVWKFNRAGDFDFACLIPGHYQAGMVGKVNVVAMKEGSPNGYATRKHILKRHLMTAALVLGAGSLWAQQPAAQASDFAEGEVRKVDKAAGKITLKHGEIKTLDMPPMTMVFVVADAAMPDQVKTGDKLRFRAANQNGKLTVTQIEAASWTDVEVSTAPSSFPSNSSQTA